MIMMMIITTVMMMMIKKAPGHDADPLGGKKGPPGPDGGHGEQNRSDSVRRFPERSRRFETYDA